MNEFEIIKDKVTGKKILQTSISGKSLLTIPQLNKGTAFSVEERLAFKLLGKLPPKIETLEEQIARSYLQFKSFNEPFKKNVFLNGLLNNNQTLFYALLRKYFAEMLPFVYTPVVGSAVIEFSSEYRYPRGLYITPNDIDNIDIIIQNRTNTNIKVIVVTDGEGVLGLGDQGVGGSDIPVAKLMLYSVCAGIDPNETLPIFLDVGTNNQKLLDDPLYMGLRHKRISQDEYDYFIGKFIESVKKNFPQVLLHWEDFATAKANNNLVKYRDELLSFNDDIQGTGVIATAATISVARITKTSLSEQRIIIYGAGAAGTGIADQIYNALVAGGIDSNQAKKCFWLIDRNGLITDKSSNVTGMQQKFMRDQNEVDSWQQDEKGQINLSAVIKNIKPTILIGTSGVHGAFTQEIVESMSCGVSMPAIFPLSNPTYCAEALPEDLIKWTNGEVLIATGSPFKDVNFNDKLYRISQCNNALAFPGLGYGAIVAKATKITDRMLFAASKAISDYVQDDEDTQLILPQVKDAAKIVQVVAIAVAKCAIKDNVAGAGINCDNIEELLLQSHWDPLYIDYCNRS
jgi:malate dehydrogenase (oxaloacetate-decarboxylating)